MINLIDVLHDCTLDMRARMQRTMLLLVAVALGSGTFVMSLGSNITAAQQISNEMASQLLDQVSLSVQDKSTEVAFPEDAQLRALSLPLVEAAGLSLRISSENIEVRRFNDYLETSVIDHLTVAGVTSGYLDVLELESGTLGAWALDKSENANVAFIGVKAAELLGIPAHNPHPRGYQVYLNNVAMDVLGILPTTPRESNEQMVYVPYATAVAYQMNDSDTTLTVRTAAGAGGNVSEVLREAVRPDRPTALTVSAVATLDTVRTGVDDQMSQLGMSVGGMLLILTTLLIANSMIVAVMSRTSEIGLRRALGSSSRDIAGLFLTEGAVIGFLGGLAGAALGVIGNLVLSVINGWSVVMPIWLPLVGLGIGIVVGVTASVYPAVSASRIDPATAIRVD